MIYDFLVYIIVAKDKKGNPRGLEKSTEVFYFTESEASSVLDKMELKEFFMVCPVIVKQATDIEFLNQIRRKV